jgi:UDP-N-acetylmuramoyl-tripeptide--D-alanyl-D-alanine ligase
MAETALWAIGDVLKACGGKPVGDVTAPLNGVAIDSRNIANGDIFVAIKGDKLDGHDYAAVALRSGAGLAIVSRIDAAMEKAGAVLLLPHDPLRGLEDLGRAARARSGARIIAVTGSVGKTSTKDMLRVALSPSGQTHASASSFNNHWGVPLTLARLSRSAAYGVFEIGMNHAGEITPLVGMVRPHIAIVTTVAASHLGHFKSLDEIADAKAEIFSGLEKGGTAVVLRDSPYFERLSSASRKLGHANIVSFGKHKDAGVRLENLVLKPDSCCIAADILGEKVTYRLGMPGEHMAVNSLAALAEARPAKGRGVQEKLATGAQPILMLDESYNANPASMRAALALLGQLQPATGGRRIAVLGDMLELGDFGPQLHAELGEDIERAKVTQLFACGPLMANLWNEIPLAKRGAYCATSGELAPLLLKDLRAGDVVMIKGSLGSRMGLLAESMRNAYAAAKGVQ